ncbi:MAG: preprotein translocase subunit SecG, partial [Verrucomicrobia bacterium]|nr:preprotein translocase subunit SecG [Verrucomicrobiota bacterium]
MLTFLHYFLMTVEVVSSILLLGVILIQRSKGQGMGTALGGGVGETMFGSQVGNVLTRTTVILAVVFLVNTTILAILGARGRESSAVDQARAVPVPTSAPVGQGPQGVSGSAPLPADFGG